MANAAARLSPGERPRQGACVNSDELVDANDTDIRLAMTGAMRKVFAEKLAQFDPCKALIAAKLAARNICKARFEAFGCAGPAARIKPVAIESMARRYR